MRSATYTNGLLIKRTLFSLAIALLASCGGGGGGGSDGAPGGGGGGGAGAGPNTNSGTNGGTGGTGGSVATTPAPDWVTRSVGLSSKLSAAAWSGSRYVAISDTGEAIISLDGINWNTKSRKTGAGPNDVVWGNNLFVSADTNGYVSTSPDGIVWTPRNICNCFDAFSAVSWSGSLFTVVGAGGRIYVSSNGIDWTQQTSGATILDVFSGIAVSPTARVAVGHDSAYAPVVRYSLDGTTWNSPTFDVTPFQGFTTALWDGSRFVVAGNGGAYTSADGAAWTQASSGPLYTDRIVWDGSKYFTTSLSGATASTDLLTWTNAFRYVNHTALDMFYSGGQYLLVGHNNWTMDAGWLATSPDGTNWTVRIGSDPKNDVIWDGSKFMALDSNGRLFNSTDGLDWNSTTGITLDYGSEVFSGLAYSPTLNRYVAASSDKIVSSDDGVTWTSRQFATLLVAQSVIWTGNKFVLVGWNGNYWDSADGITWNPKGIRGTITFMPHINDVAWSSSLGLYVVVTANPSNSILTSSDEITWNELGAAAPSGLYGIVWTGSKFVAVGTNGTIVTSADGANWTNRSITSGPTFYDVQVISGQLVAVGTSGRVFVSADDGINWVEQTSDTTNTLYAVSASPARSVAVGSVGTVITR